MGKRECFLEENLIKSRISLNTRFQAIKCLKHVNGSKEIYERFKNLQ